MSQHPKPQSAGTSMLVTDAAERLERELRVRDKRIAHLEHQVASMQRANAAAVRMLAHYMPQQADTKGRGSGPRYRTKWA